MTAKGVAFDGVGATVIAGTDPQSPWSSPAMTVRWKPFDGKEGCF